MPGLTRRDFLKTSSGALGAAALGSMLPAELAPQVRRGNPPTKIYTVFWPTAPSTDDTALRPTPNAEIVRRLEAACAGVEFVVRDLRAGATTESVVREAAGLRRSGYDGVLVVGAARDYDLLRTGLPTINAAVVNDFMNIPFPLLKQYGVVSALLDPWKFSTDPAILEQMFDDLVQKIKLIQMLKRMKTEHILTVTDSEFVNVIYGDKLQRPPAHYNEMILGAIDDVFGTRVTKIGTGDVANDPYIRNLWYSDSPEANEIARRWIRDAEEMMNTIESEVVRAAKCYLAMRRLMEKYDATAMAFHIRMLIENAPREERVYPALATSEFQLHNLVGKCQSHLNIILSEMLLQYAYGVPSMLGDYSVDTYNNTSCVQHCEGPWNPWGDERRVPYNLVDHRERQVRDFENRLVPGVGAASWILYPPDEPVTMWQIDVEDKKIFVHTGTTVPMLSRFARYHDHFYEMM